MKFVLESHTDGHVIQRYGEGEIIISERVYRKSLILLPDQVIVDWSPDTAADLQVSHFEHLAELRPEIVLLGTGRHQHFPHPSLSQPLMEQRIGLEIMDTAAACRTYNILMSEGRRVAAALFMI